MSNSIRVNGNGDRPMVDAAAYIDPTAVVIGNVRIAPDVFVGPYAVIRADEIDKEGQVQPIEIGAGCNIQDGVIVHALSGTKVTIGPRTSLAHGCVIHGPCTIGKECFIGFRAVVYKANLADGVCVSAGAVVQGADLAADTFVSPAVAIQSTEEIEAHTRPTNDNDRKFMQNVVAANLKLVQSYRENI